MLKNNSNCFRIEFPREQNNDETFWTGLLWTELLSYVCFCYLMCIVLLCVCIAVLHTLVAGLLTRSQFPEGPATGHLDTGFSWFPCVYKQILRWFPRLQVAAAWFSCSPPDLNLIDPYSIFMYVHYNHCHRTTARLQLNVLLLLLLLLLTLPESRIQTKRFRTVSAMTAPDSLANTEKIVSIINRF